MATRGRFSWTCMLSIICTVSFLSYSRRSICHGQVVQERQLQETIHEPTQLRRNTAACSSLIDNNLSLLSFGTGVTWGVDLPNPATQAYPHLLNSCDVNNAAVYSAGPNYPATCFQTLVEDNDTPYDVITFEFFHRAPTGLVDLALRVRQRYPNAIMIFISLWRPMNLHRHSPEHGWEKLGEWAERIGMKDSLHEQAFLNALMADTGNWKYPLYDQENAAIHEAARLTSGHIWRLPYAPAAADPRQAVHGRHEWFDSAFVHLSDKGHEEVANGVASLINQYSPEYQGRALGSWGQGDFCHVWFTTGVFNDARVTASDNMSLVEFDKVRGKWAFQVPPKGQISSMTFTNPFSENRKLFISFMVAKSSAIFPATHITISNSNNPSSPIQSKILQPTLTHLETNRGVDIPKTILLGHVSPGENTLTFSSDESKMLPFRVVGLLITTDDFINPDIVDFSPKFDGR